MTVTQLQQQLSSLIPSLQRKIAALKSAAASVVGTAVPTAGLTPAQFYQNQWLPLQNTLFNAQGYLNIVNNWVINDQSYAALGIARRPFPAVPNDVADALSKMTGTPLSAYQSIQGVQYNLQGGYQPGTTNSPPNNTTAKTGNPPSTTVTSGSPSLATVGGSVTTQQASPGKINPTVDPHSIQAEQRPGSGTLVSGGKPFQAYGTEASPEMADSPGNQQVTTSTGIPEPPSNLLGAFLQGVGMWFEHPTAIASNIGSEVTALVGSATPSPSRAQAAGVVFLPIAIAWALFFRK